MREAGESKETGPLFPCVHLEALTLEAQLVQGRQSPS